MATMSEPMAPAFAETAVRLCDDTYMMWCTAAVDAEHALRDWFDATPGERVLRYFAYRAALDREEAAARYLQRLSELIEPCHDALTRASLTPITASPASAAAERPVASM